MNLWHYGIRIRIKWKNGGTSLGDWDCYTDDLQEIFLELFQEVVVKSLMDPFTDEITEPLINIRNIHINIRKLSDFG